jgi:hypothetical protein
VTVETTTGATAVVDMTGWLRRAALGDDGTTIVCMVVVMVAGEVGLCPFTETGES